MKKSIPNLEHNDRSILEVIQILLKKMPCTFLTFSFYISFTLLLIFYLMNFFSSDLACLDETLAKIENHPKHTGLKIGLVAHVNVKI